MAMPMILYSPTYTCVTRLHARVAQLPARRAPHAQVLSLCSRVLFALLTKQLTCSLRATRSKFTSDSLVALTGELQH